MSYQDRFPEKVALMMWSKSHLKDEVADVNAHLHTPYSFSAFESVDQALNHAQNENVRVVGINDFYTMEGYEEWAGGALSRNLFPLFNIELIALNKEYQSEGVRVNDPNNPGRTYLSGKALAFPVQLDSENAGRLEALRTASVHHVERMCDALNLHLKGCQAPFVIDFKEVQEQLTRGLVRERHLAKAVRIKASENYREVGELKAFYQTLFNGKELRSDLADAAALENEIRNNLLKAGGPAFVKEDDDAFPDVATAVALIRAAGGIPTYPFLADDAKGGFTDFELDTDRAAYLLQQQNIWSVEFITTRNSAEVLERYADFFYQRGFVVTFGSEHNTPAMEPVLLTTRDGKELSPLLKKINYESACILAAHQYMVATEGLGYLSREGKARFDWREYCVRIGNALIQYTISNQTDLNL